MYPVDSYHHRASDYVRLEEWKTGGVTIRVWLCTCQGHYFVVTEK